MQAHLVLNTIRNSLWLYFENGNNEAGIFEPFTGYYVVTLELKIVCSFLAIHLKLLTNFDSGWPGLKADQMKLAKFQSVAMTKQKENFKEIPHTLAQIRKSGDWGG